VAARGRQPHLVHLARTGPRRTAFRVDVARVGGQPEAITFAAELQATSSEFRRLWAENDVRAHWVGLKRFQHPVVGPFSLETSAFNVDGLDGLSMMLFTPVSAEDARAVSTILALRPQLQSA